MAHRELALHVCDEEAEGREHAGGGGDDGDRAVQKLHERVGVQRPGAAEGDERERAWVLAALNGDEPQAAQHLLVRDRDDRAGGFLETDAQALRHSADRSEASSGCSSMRPPEQARGGNRARRWHP